MRCKSSVAAALRPQALFALFLLAFFDARPSAWAQTAPVITQDLTNENVLISRAVTFNVGVSGPPPFSYQWQLNGAPLPDLITTAAGNGKAVLAGDNGPADAASLYWPADVALDAGGNLFVADFFNNRIRKVDTNGMITTVAGSGTTGQGSYSGDGGLALNAELSWPTGVLVDAAGNLFIADFNNNRVRKVDSNGIITTVAGNGNAGYAGDEGSATNTELDGPWGLVLDAAGDLIFSDCYNSVIRRVDTNGIISTIAGNGLQDFAGDGMAATNASLNDPSGLCLDNSGNLFIADYGNNRIREINSNGIITTVVGGGSAGLGDGGQATNALLSEPSKVVMDSAGNLLIADTDNNRIRQVEPNGMITTIAGTGTNAYSGDGDFATNASLNQPWGLAVDASDNVWIADTLNERMRKVFINNTSTLTLTNLNLQVAGAYSVVISNNYGSVTSSVSVLTILSRPILSVQPQSLSIEAGFSAEMSVTAEGTTPFNYQWFFDGAALSGQTNNSLAFLTAGTQNTGNYQVVVTNLYGAATSKVATMTVQSPIAFTPVWKPTTAPHLYWSSVASSADGSVLVANAGENGVYISTNFGDTWTSNALPAGSGNVALSPAGATLLAVGTSCYISTNTGASWQLSSDLADVSSAVFSADGVHVIAFSEIGYFSSSNSGATWTYNTNRLGAPVAMSGDGTFMINVGNNTIGISTNSGASWLPGTSYGDHEFFSVTCSADGSRFTASDGTIQLSTNLGVTWRQSSVPGGARQVIASVDSVDGSRLVTIGDSDRAIYTSFDFGITWVLNNCPLLQWLFMACSQDGTRLVATQLSTETASTIYTAQWPPDLTITSTGGSILLSWPAPSTGFVLQENTDSSLTNWTPVPIAPVTTNYQNQVTIPASSNALFFRLAGPSF